MKTKKTGDLAAERLARVKREIDSYSASVRLTEPEAAAVLGQSPATLKFWRLNAPGRGPTSIKMNGSVRYAVGALREFQSRAPV
jgi:hypothetical protein